MFKKTFLFLLCFISLPVFAQDSDKILTAEEILVAAHTEYPTPCATEKFAAAVANELTDEYQNASEAEVRAIAHRAMFDGDVLREVLDCPELQRITDRLTTITFTPIVYTFTNEREITINYTTQLKVLDQKLALTDKPSLPNGDPSPRLMDENDPAIYINTDPAWYAIMVVEHGSLSNFVGEKKNNTLSLQWINDNIDNIYPRGAFCTSKSALANDHYTINEVVHEIADLDKDTNDYYVAGDVNLEWIMYAEIAFDIVLTIVTVGGSEVAMVAAKAARAARTLSKLDDVKDYVNIARKIANQTKEIEKIEKQIKKTKDVAKLEKLKRQQKELQESVKGLEKTASDMEKASENVKQFKESAKAVSDLMKYQDRLLAFKRPQTGNIFTRNLKRVKAGVTTIKAANQGAKVMNKAGRVARAGMSSRSARIGDWLIDSTLKHGARLARVGRDLGMLYGAVAFLGELYDKTSNTSDEYTNGIEFKPLCLLSADDLEGQENVVNYGMWLMWLGNSVDPADDDAAYLQSMDFAEKFSYVLNEYQDEHGKNCNVDIYVVRPIIRLDESDPENTRGELFYLFMNDKPWTTAE